MLRIGGILRQPVSLRARWVRMRFSWRTFHDDLVALLTLLRTRRLRFALRHWRLREKVYKPWLERTIRESGIFDQEFYIRRYIRGEVLIDPFTHYIRRGIYWDLSPNASFNPVWYRLRHMPTQSRRFPAVDLALRKDCLPCRETPPSPERDYFSAHFREVQFLLQERKIALAPDAAILEFGCGAGDTVAEMREAGFNIFGYDIIPRLSEKAQKYSRYFSFLDKGQLATEDAAPGLTNYHLRHDAQRLPFPDGTFDLIVSWQTLEHVANLENSLAEMARVLRPGGTAIHIYPPRNCFLERHYNVPLGHRLHYRWYYRFWSLVGMCGRHCRELSAAERARRGWEYARLALNYTENSRMEELARRYYENVSLEPWPSRASLNPLKALWRRLFPADVILVCRKAGTNAGARGKPAQRSSA